MNDGNGRSSHRKCSVNISQISQEGTCVGVLGPEGLQLFETESNISVFL